MHKQTEQLPRLEVKKCVLRKKCDVKKYQYTSQFDHLMLFLPYFSSLFVCLFCSYIRLFTSDIFYSSESKQSATETWEEPHPPFRFLAAFPERSLHPGCQEQKAGETANCVNWLAVKIVQIGHKLHSLDVESVATSVRQICQ